MCKEEVNYSVVKENLQMMIGKGTKGCFCFDKEGQTCSVPVLIRNSFGTVQEAVFVYCVDMFSADRSEDNVLPPTEWLKFNLSDGMFVLYADRRDYDFYDKGVVLPKYVYQAEYSLDESVAYLVEIRDHYKEIKKFAFRTIVSRREKEILVKYRNLMFTFSPDVLRPFYYALGKDFFDWIDTVKVVEEELPF